MNSIKSEKQVTGKVDEVVALISGEMNINLDKEKFEFLRLIMKTKYSGLTLVKLVSTLQILNDKDDRWFSSLLRDGLAETFKYSGPNGRYDSAWEGWFITKKGRRIVSEVLNKL